MPYTYKRTLPQLETHACKWWPENLTAIEAESSIVPTLIRTQDQFISILTLSNTANPLGIFSLITASDFSANLFLKHLMVLTDFGSEPLQRINRDFENYFPNNKLNYVIDGQTWCYEFSTLPVKGTLTNKKMLTDVEHILHYEPLTPFFKDLIMLLLFGGNSTEDVTSVIFSKCNVGNLMGKADELKEFIKQRYIFVSRITGGAQANGLGNAAQIYAENYFKEKLGEDYHIKSNGHIPNVTQNDRTLTTFDLSIEHNGRYVGVEISFQVTTNSTIERKAGQAQDRFNQVEATNNYIAYIIDGAGNFQRVSALTTICENSHCTIAYTDEEFEVLLNFIKEKIG
ncbi:MAG: restriction endonuclease [Clostridia bacterium]|nr:restriction endonuclease [Clostridia bacterium]MBQ9984898.1 hypothetical protein [Oscillospiraceae bacterium]